MNKNLVFVAAGDTSLHHLWLNSPDFDVFINYYGEVKGRYERDSQFYSTFKGTKFNILLQVMESRPELLDCYENIWIPDDDLFIEGRDVSRLFKVFTEFNLSLAQPGIIGYMSIPISAAVPFSRLRYTNWVEIMCPVFTRDTLKLVVPTFTENKSHWGIEFLWNLKLGEPKDKIAIIDEVIAVHTRACFHGDNYYRNNLTYESSIGDANAVMRKHQLAAVYGVYSMVQADPKDFYELASQDKFVPAIPKLREIVDSMRGRKIII